MSTETLYFIIGFLLGSMIMSCVAVALAVVIYEWFDQDRS